MKKYFSFLVFLLYVTAVSAQDVKFPKLKSNTVGLVGSNLMIDQGEVCMGDWFSYIYNLVVLDNGGGSVDTLLIRPSLWKPRKV